MSADLNEGQCVICLYCDTKSESVDSHLVEVRQKGLETLKSYCGKRKATTLLNQIKNYEESGHKVKVHSKCRRDFTDPKRLKKDSSEPAVKKIRLRSTDDFNWKNNCFLCTENAELDKRHVNREHVVQASTLQLRNSILQQCSIRSDHWADEVKGRLQDCIDFIAAEALYHKKCYTKFLNSSCSITASSSGRPVHNGLAENFEKMCYWLENECEMEVITLDELHDKMKSLSDDQESYSKKWLKVKLGQRFGDHLIFSEIDGKKNVLCFKDMMNYIISRKWHNEKKENVEDEALRIITTAAKLIRQEIQKLSLKTEFYPTTQEIKESTINNSWCPLLLKTFLSKVVPNDIKQASIGQCIIKAARPRTAIPPLLFGMGIEADHVFGSRWLVDELFKLGFSISYSEVNRFKQSVIQSEDLMHPNQNQYPEMFTQYVADNVDHNLVTLDGSGSFHGMGIISVSTPTTNFTDAQREIKVHREKVIKSKALTFDKGIPIEYYTAPFKSALSTVKMKPFKELFYPFVSYDSSIDLLWQSSWFFSTDQSQRPSWSGYMQYVSTGNYPGASKISFLPIIDLDPNNHSCIYSTLLFIRQQSHAQNIPTACITFDQPLWLKSMEIIKAKSLKIVTRLGGFHLLMSFIGSIGKVMESSGLGDVLETIYGSNTVKHILSGKAISRALRGHFLVQSALMLQLLQPLLHFETSDSNLNNLDNQSVIPHPLTEILQPFNDHELKEMAQVSSDAFQNKNTTKCIESSSMQKLNESLTTYKDYLCNESRTAKLWITYIYYIDIVKEFIRAERRGDWCSHLNAVSKMLNLFAATGHFNYAKSARLYLQSMQQLPDDYPWLHNQFVEHGFHTIRRSDRFWAGLWSDLVIEQALMRTLKDRGGLTRGRGMAEAVRLLWVYSMHKCSEVHGMMSEITEVKHTTSDQHKELGTSRVARDNSDLDKILTWFRNSSPFTPLDPNLRCLHSGLTSIKGNDTINCENAEYIGYNIQSKFDNTNFNEITFKKADCVNTLIKLQKSVVVENTHVQINPSGLFTRLIAVVDRSNTIEECFEYELTQEPTSLFKDSFMRKPNKSDLIKLITTDIDHLDSLPTNSKTVIDGGAFLHQVKWQKSSTYEEVFNQYCNYLESKYGICNVVFDGYDSGPSIKDHEHLRRTKTSCPYVKIAKSSIAHKDQHVFLTNDENKSQFIHLLSGYLERRGFIVQQSINDADTNIVKAALDLALTGNVTVVADDTDVLVLLLHHYKDEMGDVFFYSEVSRRSKEGPKVFNLRTLRLGMNRCVLKNILFLHAWSGCDTTSATFGKGKMSTVKTFSSSVEFQSLSEIFYSRNASHIEISNAGASIFSILYKGRINDDLNKLRYTHYMNMVSKSITAKPESLPPTNAAADFHSYRVHFQVVEWDTFLQSGLQATDWGWKLKGDQLCPITTSKEPAPPEILNVIRCNCKMSSTTPCSSNRCPCKNNGIWCMAACGDCHGEDCHNVKSEYEDNELLSDNATDDDEPDDGNIFDLFE